MDYISIHAQYGFVTSKAITDSGEAAFATATMLVVEIY